MVREPTAVASASLAAVPEPADAQEPGPDPADSEHAPDALEAVGPPAGAEIAAARVSSTAEGDESDDAVHEPPSIHPVRVEQVKALEREPARRR